ncbi:AIR synthase related protein [Candidatus Omnitrophota bacterium]
MVRTDTIFLPGHDAALVRIKGSDKGIAVSTDCNSLYCYLDPFEGGKIALAESARNVACTGARPLAFTNCLNFGNPMKPEIFWQFKKCVEGIRNAALKFMTPVTGGNVSLYNENPQGAIYPTPTIAMVGVMDDCLKSIQSFFKSEGDSVYLLGDTLNELGASHYLMVEHGLKMGIPPQLDLDKEFQLHEFLILCANEKLVESFHDISEGGFAVALAECCFAKNLGIKVNGVKDYCSARNIRLDAFLFGETQSRVIASVSRSKVKQFETRAKELKVPFMQIGTVGGNVVSIDKVIKIKVKELKTLFEGVLPNALGRL